MIIMKVKSDLANYVYLALGKLKFFFLIRPKYCVIFCTCKNAIQKVSGRGRLGTNLRTFNLRFFHAPGCWDWANILILNFTLYTRYHIVARALGL